MYIVVDLRYCTSEQKHKACKAFSIAFNTSVMIGYSGIEYVRSIVYNPDTDTYALCKCWVPCGRPKDFITYTAKTFINLGSL